MPTSYSIPLCNIFHNIINLTPCHCSILRHRYNITPHILTCSLIEMIYTYSAALVFHFVPNYSNQRLTGLRVSPSVQKYTHILNVPFNIIKHSSLQTPSLRLVINPHDQFPFSTNPHTIHRGRIPHYLSLGNEPLLPSDLAPDPPSYSPNTPTSTTNHHSKPSIHNPPVPNTHSAR
jgi:hypothetical protein